MQFTFKGTKISNSKVIALAGICILILSLIVFGAVARGVSMKMFVLSNISQINVATLAYAADFDEVFPAATSMQSIRAILIPYAKSKRLFESSEGNVTAPAFNFNLAGVSTKLPPYPGTKQVDPHYVIMWHSRLLSQEGGWVTGRCNGAYPPMSADRADEFQLMLTHQFDRKGAKLFLPDYLADKDPLK